MSAVKAAVFGGYDRRAADALLEDLQEKTNQANLRAAQLETQLAESNRMLSEKSGEFSQQLALKERQAEELEKRLSCVETELNVARAENGRLQHLVEEYERKIEKVGQIYITAYDEAEKITSGARERTGEAIDTVSGVMRDANQKMKRQLSSLIMAKESLKETLSNVNETMRQSFEVFTQQTLMIDDVLSGMDDFADDLKEEVGSAYHKAATGNGSGADSACPEKPDFIEQFQK